MTRVIPTGENRPSTYPCVVCGEMIEGPGADYCRVQILAADYTVVYEAREATRRHFLNDSHTVSLREPIDHKPVAWVGGFGR